MVGLCFFSVFFFSFFIPLFFFLFERKHTRSVFFVFILFCFFREQRLTESQESCARDVDWVGPYGPWQLGKCNRTNFQLCEKITLG